MAQDKYVLVATPVGLTTEQSSIDMINAFNQGGYTGQYSGCIFEEGQIRLKAGGALIDPSKPDDNSKIHFIHIYPLSTEVMEAITAAGHFEGVIVAPEYVSANVNTKFGIRIGAGTNNFEQFITQPGRVVMNTPGVNANGTAQWTMECIMQGLKKTHITVATIGEGVKGRKLYTGTRDFQRELYQEELAAKTVAVIGSGNIAQQVIARLVAEGVKDIRVCSPSVGDDKVAGLAKYGTTITVTKDIQVALKGADICTLHCPLTDATMNLIGRDQIAVMNPGATLVNFARPDVVNINALEEALSNGQLKNAYVDGDIKLEPGPDKRETDVGKPFVDLARSYSNLVVLPHVGGDTTQQARTVGVEQAVKQAFGYMIGGQVTNLAKQSGDVVVAGDKVTVDGREFGRSQEAVSLAVTEAKMRHALDSMGGHLRGASAGLLREAANVIEKFGPKTRVENLRTLAMAINTLYEQFPTGPIAMRA